MFDGITSKNNFELITIAVIITIILGMGISVFFLLINKDPYSSIYIIPNSITHNSTDNSVLYTYGVKSSESGKMDYKLDTYLNSTLIKTKQFSLNKGEILDERSGITLPTDVVYPAKISLELSTKTSQEEVHFWLEE
jgi:hypothetical protein